MDEFGTSFIRNAIIAFLLAMAVSFLFVWFR
jgi:preprotein translocase subunit SecD